MKMTKEDYNLLKEAIIKQGKLEDLQATHNEVISGTQGKDKEMLFRWEIFWRVNVQSKIKTLLMHGYTDNHIDTALKQIFKEIRIK